MSLNDGKLYGVDLRLRNKAQGQLAVSLLPYGARSWCGALRASPFHASRLAVQRGIHRAPATLHTRSRPRHAGGRGLARERAGHVRRCGLADPPRTRAPQPAAADATTPRSRQPELIGAFWDDNGFGRGSSLSGELLTASAKTVGGQLYYVYETASHNLITANVTDGQLYLLTVSAGNERQWRSSEAVLRRIAGSFAVPA